MIIKLSQTEQPKTTHIYYLTINNINAVILWIQVRAWANWILCTEPHRLQSSVGWAAFSSGGLTEEESPSMLVLVAGRLCFLIALLLRAPRFLLDVSWMLPLSSGGSSWVLEITSSSLSHGLLQHGHLVHGACRESLSPV